MKKIIVAVIIGSVVAGTVALYATGVYARRGRGRVQDFWPGPSYGYTQILEVSTELLGMSVDELKKEFDAGKSIRTIAEEKDLTLQDFHQKMLAVQKERLENLVKAGFLTQEQLEIRLQLIEQHHAYCEENEYGIWYEDSVWSRGMLPWARRGSFPGMRWVR